MAKKCKHQQADAEHGMPADRRIFHADTQQHRQAGQQQDDDGDPYQLEKSAQRLRDKRKAQRRRQQLGGGRA